ncbi:hypothetical protein LMG28614_07232 [Paraburkholderia ultramafica]|uniref:Uncharacterized protein n=1 Tax=Paraburkholderia ultramafica TaxID=1544867 RepID=A0A6S7CIV8_9BURK|nr:hypothetical protein LMG28614_07232 [Paraburkholderia ultramafica]
MHGRHFATRRGAMDEVIDWLGFYNARLIHSTLDYVSPMTFAINWFAAQQGEACVIPSVMGFTKQGQGHASMLLKTLNQWRTGVSM